MYKEQIKRKQILSDPNCKSYKKEQMTENKSYDKNQRAINANYSRANDMKTTPIQ